MSEVPVADELKAALLNREGRCGMLFDLVLSYESANWDNINSLAEELGIPNQVITSIYFTCMENVRVLWDQLTNPYLDQLAPVEEEVPEESSEKE